MTPTTAAVIALSGAVNFRSLCVVSMNGAPGHDCTKEGREENQVTTMAATAPARNWLSGPNAVRSTFAAAAADEAHESDHHDQWPGRRFTQRQAIDHLQRRQPAEISTAP